MVAEKIVEKALEGKGVSKEEATYLYGVDSSSEEAQLIIGASYKLSQQASSGKAQIHAQIGLDASPCERDCLFCSFASRSGLRVGTYELGINQIVESSLDSIERGANLILMLTTANYEFGKLLNAIEHTRKAIGPEYPILVGTDDFTFDQALLLKKAGCNGAYHALRLGEGVYTSIAIETRKSTIENTHAAGLKHCTCVEPIGPEHTPKELTQRTMYALESNPVFGGAWRRESIPGSKHELPMIDDRQWALYAAVFRLVAGLKFPFTTSMASKQLALAGANLAWAEIGTNPRDVRIDSENSLGMTISKAKAIFDETGWEVLKGPATEWMSDYEGPINRSLLTYKQTS